MKNMSDENIAGCQSAQTANNDTAHCSLLTAHCSLPFARPFIGKEEEEAVLRVLRSGWLTTGAEALAFEKEFCGFLSAPPACKKELYCLAVNSATSGLHLALEACGVGQGDKVLVPSYTFASTAEVVRYLRADPVFVDLGPGTFHIDPVSIEKTIINLECGKVKAIIPVHFGGFPCDMKPIMDISQKYNLKVIEDAAHSFPSLIGNRDQGLGIREGGDFSPLATKPPASTLPPSAGDTPATPPNHGLQSLIPDPRSPFFAGTIGDVGVFSFYATKTITTGEGGMVVCRDKAIADKIAVMRSHGIDRSTWNRYTDTKASWYYEVQQAGYKYNLPDLLAAIGRIQLTRAWQLLKMREDIASLYDNAFSADPRFIIPCTGKGDARHIYPLRLNLQKLNITRDKFIEELKDAGIGVSVHFIPLHTMPYYKKLYNLKADDFPETMKSYLSEISLPIWPGMKKAQVERVIDLVESCASRYTIK